ncbi:Hypothetical Protein FCC1311_061602 [Hondaea fermentalgiana]|uniref:Uncharacterized protein n=1 Tax=Hondaea fermentalgiana TaxID=2315210 RepID=A0A2R5GGE2_9STRA|nr:Hypothetical Protein FCC1311_061602 [Hondaea fermentalgiana]|eukprot:GBG29940.1 Hypothetical Protein FCC1311_061602 [Hondaea fermentalgiana]
MMAEVHRAESPRPKSVVFAESVKTYDASASLHAVNLILAVFTGQVTTSEQLLNSVPQTDLRADLIIKLQRVSDALQHANAEINVNGVILTHASKKYVDRMIRDFRTSCAKAKFSF